VIFNDKLKDVVFLTSIPDDELLFIGLLKKMFAFEYCKKEFITFFEQENELIPLKLPNSVNFLLKTNKFAE
jgi:hypothetical protein